MPTTLPAVDGYIRKNKRWSAELSELRRILHTTPLAEAFKWRNPCYTWDDTNVIILGAYADGAVISFLQGALMKDPKGLLTKPGENTRSARVIRFAEAAQILKLETTLKAYLTEAIALAQSGQTFDFKNDAPPEHPAELTAAFVEMPELKTAFAALTPGRQRAYILQFNGAKQSATRAARIEKAAAAIFAGKGPNDDYKQKAKPRRPARKNKTD